MYCDPVLTASGVSIPLFCFLRFRSQFIPRCQDFRIRNIPTLLFFKGGEMVNRLVGAVPKSEITAILDSII